MIASTTIQFILGRVGCGPNELQLTDLLHPWISFGEHFRSFRVARFKALKWLPNKRRDWHVRRVDVLHALVDQRDQSFSISLQASDPAIVCMMHVGRHLPPDWLQNEFAKPEAMTRTPSGYNASHNSEKSDHRPS